MAEKEYLIERTEIFYVKGEDANDAIERLDEMDDVDEAAHYDRRVFKVYDDDGNEQKIDWQYQ